MATSSSPSEGARVIPVVLAGGVGTRLWPLSREERPKQFLPLTSEKSMLQETFLRMSDEALFEPPAVVCHARYAEMVQAQANEIDCPLSALILEPIARNSAPAIAAAALHFAAIAPDALLLVCPADHLILDPERFQATVRAASKVAASGRLTTFGIQPDRPETGYGYIRGGAQLNGGAGREVAAFVEKPDLATAETYLASGEYYWNSGMFLFRPRDMIAELERHAPEVLECVREAIARAPENGHAVALDAETFGAAPSISIDYAVMEKTAHAAVAPAAFNWSDIGAWDALAEKIETDGDGNTTVGEAHVIDGKGVYCRSEGPFVAAIGVEDLVIVATPEAVLITRKSDCQKVKSAAQKHKER